MILVSGNVFYNAICLAKCGHCLIDEACDKVTGECLKDCKAYQMLGESSNK